VGVREVDVLQVVHVPSLVVLLDLLAQRRLHSAKFM
jgi:hypothetical protein